MINCCSISVNAVVVPCFLVLLFVKMYFKNIGKKHRKIMFFYIVEFVLIHVCIVFIQLILSGLNAPKVICELLKYLFYFCIISCFVWLCLLNDDVWRTLKDLKKSDELRRDSMMQDVMTAAEIRRFKVYYIVGFTIPTAFTTLAIILTKFALQEGMDQVPEKFAWSEPDIFGSVAFCMVFLPVVILLIGGFIRFGQTMFYVQATLAERREDNIQRQNELEKKRFVAKQNE